MAQKLYEETNIQNIANAIRGKLGVSTTYKPSEMASAISSIETGGSGIAPTGTIEITENGEFDVTNFAKALVEVASSGSGNMETGTFTLTSNLNGSSFVGHEINHSLGVVPKFAICYPKLTFDECIALCTGTHTFIWFACPLWQCRCTLNGSASNFSASSHLAPISETSACVRGTSNTVTFGSSNYHSILAGVEFEYIIVA